MNKKLILEKMKEAWPDWDDDAYEAVLNDAINLLGGTELFEKFSHFNWQEQDCILSVLRAFRGW